jgi:predicted nucleic acid-binding protein
MEFGLGSFEPSGFGGVLRNSDAQTQAWLIEDRWQFSWWDSLIVAAALVQNCRTLLTEDLQDGLEIDGLRVVNPFEVEFDLAKLNA